MEWPEIYGGIKDAEEDRERLRQRMDDLLRDARALRALIEEASDAERQGDGGRRLPDSTAPSPRGRRSRG